MATNESIGGISVEIVGNYAPLQKDLASAVSIAQSAGAEVAAGFNKGATASSEFEAKIKALVDSGSTLAEALKQVQSGSSATATAMAQAAAATGQAASVAQSAASALQTLAAEARRAGEEAQQSGNKWAAFKDKLADASNQFQASARGLAVIGAGLTAAITVPLVGIATAAVEAAGKMEQAKVAFTTLLGSADAAQKHLEELKKFAASTPFEFPQLVEASKRLQALGFTAKEIIPTLTAVGNAASAMGSGQEGINRITLALGQMQMATKVTAQDMRQLTESGIPAWQILAKTLNTDVAGAMEMVHKRMVESAQAVPALLAGMNEKFAGLMEAQNKTLLGQWSNFKDQLSFTLIDIGNTLAPMASRILTEGLMPLLDWAKNAAHEFSQLSPAVQNVAIGVAAIGAAAGPALLALGGFGMAMSQIATALPIIQAAAGGIATVFGIGLVSAVAGVAAGFLDLDRAMVSVHQKESAIEKGFNEYVQIMMQCAHSARDLADAEAFVTKALENGALAKDQAAKLLAQIHQEQSKLVGKDWQEYAKEIGLTVTVIKTGVQEAAAGVNAYAVKLEYLKSQVKATAEALDSAKAKFAETAAGTREHARAAEEVAKALDASVGAHNALKAAQEAMLPVVANLRVATKEYVDIARRDLPDVAKNLQNIADATNVKLAAQNDTLINAQKYLDAAIERWNKYHDNANAVITALSALEAAQKAVNDELSKFPDIGKEFEKWEKGIREAAKAIPALLNMAFPTEAPPFIRTLEIDLKQLGITATETGDTIRGKLFAAFDDLALKQNPTLEQARLAWGQVSSAVRKLAESDLPAAISKYEEYEALLQRVGGAQGELLAVQEESLQAQIELAAESGKDATEQVVALHQVRLAHQALRDQALSTGEMITHIQDAIIKGWDDTGKAIADCIVEGRNLEQALMSVIKNIAKAVLEELVGKAFKDFRNSLQDIDGQVNKIAESFKKLGSTVSGTIGGSGESSRLGHGLPTAGHPELPGEGSGEAAGAASGGSGGILGSLGGMANALNLVLNLINDILQSIQLAHLNKTMGKVEENTRFLEIKFAKFAEADEWQRHNEILDKFGMEYTRLGDLWSTMQAVRDAVNMTDSAGQITWLWTQQHDLMVGQFNSFINLWGKTNDYLNRMAGVLDPGGAQFPSSGTSTAGDAIKDNGWLWSQMSPMLVAQFNANNGVMHSIDDRLKTGVDTYLKNIQDNTATAKTYLIAISGALGAVPKFASGTAYVPHDMLAVVHQGEAIIPANQVAAATATMTLPTIAEGSLSYAHQSTTVAAQAAESPQTLTAAHIGMSDAPLVYYGQQQSAMSLPTIATGNQLASMATALPSIPSPYSSSTMLATSSGPQSVAGSSTYGAMTQNFDIKVYETSNPRETARQLALTLKTLTGRLGPGTGS